MRGVYFIIFLICVLQVASGAILSAYLKVGAIDRYTYHNSTSTCPSCWGTITEVVSCTTRQAQSPVDNPCGGEEEIGRRSKLEYMTTVLGLLSKTENGSLRSKDYGKCGQAQLSGSRYNVKNVHFRAPSEHFFNGKRNALDPNVVHVSARKNHRTGDNV